MSRKDRDDLESAVYEALCAWSDRERRIDRVQELERRRRDHVVTSGVSPLETLPTPAPAPIPAPRPDPSKRETWEEIDASLNLYTMATLAITNQDQVAARIMFYPDDHYPAFHRATVSLDLYRANGQRIKNWMLCNVPLSRALGEVEKACNDMLMVLRGDR